METIIGKRALKAAGALGILREHAALTRAINQARVKASRKAASTLGGSASLYSTVIISALEASDCHFADRFKLKKGHIVSISDVEITQPFSETPVPMRGEMAKKRLESAIKEIRSGPIVYYKRAILTHVKEKFGADDQNGRRRKAAKKYQRGWKIAILGGREDWPVFEGV